MTSPGINEETLESWERVVEDMAATAEDYREDGWNALECHPGDVTAIADSDTPSDDARTGIDVLLGDNEFDEAAGLVDESGEFDEVDVFRAERGGVVYLVAALENDATETVILVPAYYSVQSSQDFVQMVRREDELRMHLRPLDLRRILTFTQSDPSPFLPGSN